MLVPASIVYDHPLDTQADLSVCSAFLAALESSDSPDNWPCLQGNCPNYSDLTVVCPSGFWGYRHELGLPVSITKGKTGDVPAEIEFTDPASLGCYRFS